MLAPGPDDRPTACREKAHAKASRRDCLRDGAAGRPRGSWVHGWRRIASPISTYLMAAAAAETGKEGRALCACAQIERVFPRELLVPRPRSALRRAGEAPPFAAAGGRRPAACTVTIALEAAGSPATGTWAEAVPWDRVSPCALSSACPMSPAEAFSFVA